VRAQLQLVANPQRAAGRGLTIEADTAAATAFQNCAACAVMQAGMVRGNAFADPLNLAVRSTADQQFVGCQLGVLILKLAIGQLSAVDAVKVACPTST